MGSIRRSNSSLTELQQQQRSLTEARTIRRGTMFFSMMMCCFLPVVNALSILTAAPLVQRHYDCSSCYKKRTVSHFPCVVHMSSESPPLFETELVNDDDDEEEDWMPDMEKAKRVRSYKSAMAEPYPTTKHTSVPTSTGGHVVEDASKTKNKKKLHVYSEEEERLIEALGGKAPSSSNKREPGYLGDCTLKEISMDYSVPICYLADVLCAWGVEPPIHIHARLGDLVTGEQAFSMLEAIHTLDLASLHDRYSNYDLVALCQEYDLDLRLAFEFVGKEGWSLPFGVRTFLRIEQEDALIHALSTDIW